VPPLSARPSSGSAGPTGLQWKKQKTLSDMAEKEDWLSGKPGSQLKK